MKINKLCIPLKELEKEQSNKLRIKKRKIRVKAEINKLEKNEKKINKWKRHGKKNKTDNPNLT